MLEKYYEAIDQWAEEYAKEHEECDEVALKSLAKSIIYSDINIIDMPKSSILRPERENSDRMVSYKLRNVTLSFGDALELISGIKAVIDKDAMALIAALYNLIEKFFTEIPVKLDEYCSSIVFAIHFLDFNSEGVEEERLFKYIIDKKDDMHYWNVLEEKQIREKITESCEVLEKSKTLLCIDGKYKLNEKIMPR